MNAQSRRLPNTFIDFFFLWWIELQEWNTEVLPAEFQFATGKGAQKNLNWISPIARPGDFMNSSGRILF